MTKGQVQTLIDNISGLNAVSTQDTAEILLEILNLFSKFSTVNTSSSLTIDWQNDFALDEEGVTTTETYAQRYGNDVRVRGEYKNDDDKWVAYGGDFYSKEFTGTTLITVQLNIWSESKIFIGNNY